jgi:hypothetical protein
VRRTRGPRPITPFTHQSARKLPPKISHSCVTRMAWSSVLLPPHGISIDIESVKVSLNHVIAYDTDVLSRVEVFLRKVWTQNNALPRQTNPNHYLLCTLHKFDVMIMWRPIATRCVFSNVPPPLTFLSNFFLGHPVYLKYYYSFVFKTCDLITEWIFLGKSDRIGWYVRSAPGTFTFSEKSRLIISLLGLGAMHALIGSQAKKLLATQLSKRCIKNTHSHLFIIFQSNKKIELWTWGDGKGRKLQDLRAHTRAVRYGDKRVILSVMDNVFLIWKHSKHGTFDHFEKICPL